MERLLNVTVYKAVLTKDVCMIGSMSPQFIAKLSNLKSYRSAVRDNEGKLPKWNETFTFRFEDESSLTIEVLHKTKAVNLN